METAGQARGAGEAENMASALWSRTRAWPQIGPAYTSKFELRSVGGLACASSGWKPTCGSHEGMQMQQKGPRGCRMLRFYQDHALPHTTCDRAPLFPMYRLKAASCKPPVSLRLTTQPHNFADCL